uniref:Putative nuclear transcription factor y subunit beta-like protein n=1 Tax=Tabanus bromius TaxID=304241 RepID=A0A0K8TR36_TABBR
MNSSNDSMNNPQSFLNDSYMMPEDIEVSDDSSNDNMSNGGTKASGLLREQDRFLPICNIVKIMKKAIPENGKIAKDARECIQECVSEFISFITSEAIDRSHEENRKTVNGDDILHAMNVLGFENYIEPLSLYLYKYRESTKSDRNLIYQNDVNTILFEDSSGDFKPPLNGNVTDILGSNAADDPVMYYQGNQSGGFNL